jgi:hypothetical protein
MQVVRNHSEPTMVRLSKQTSSSWQALVAYVAYPAMGEGMQNW